MSNSDIARLLQNRVSFLSDAGAEEDIAISSRIRLARNVEGFFFPAAAQPPQLEAVRDLVSSAVADSGALDDDFLRFDTEKLTPLDQEILFERRLVSRDLLSRGGGTALLTKSDESCSVMVNEEDHLRIQAIRPGLQLMSVWNDADRLDTNLASNLNYSFDSKLGFLTSCPTNVGTGMRASVMLHLPGLVLAGQINTVIQGISKLNLAVRGIFGEGSDNRGNLFQISNQSTLGESETQIIERLNAVIMQLIAHEKDARRVLLEKEKYSLLDGVGRSYGLLRYAYKLTYDEALNSLSWLRVGVDMGVLRSVEIRTVNELFIGINPAHLNHLAGRPLSDADADIQRAVLVRERLGKTAQS